MTTLDFRPGKKLPSQYSPMFNTIASEAGRAFTRTIDYFGAVVADSIDWWVSNPASRDTLASPMFHYTCCLMLLKRMTEQKTPVDRIIVDSPALERIICRFLDEVGQEIVVELRRLPLRRRIRRLFKRVVENPALRFKLYRALRATRPNGWKSFSEPITLVDTFMLPGTVQNDRYYPGMMDILTDRERRSIVYSPFLFKFRADNYRKFVEELRTSNRRLLIREDHLKVVDFVFAWLYAVRILLLPTRQKAIVDGFDIAQLVKEELRGYRGFNTSFAALLSYRFVRRIRETGIPIRRVIDWFENQTVDKGTNKGFRRYYPQTPIIGYQGFVNYPHFLSKYPSIQECKSRVIPEEVHVIGPALVEPARKFCPGLTVKVAPGFRFSHLWRDQQDERNGNGFIVLVTLHIVMTEVVALLDLLYEALDSISADIRIWIKPHPATKQEKVRQVFSGKWPERFEIVQGEFNEMVNRADLLIGSASTTCMEALARGIPVIVVGNNHGLTQNAIPDTIQSDIWTLCHTAGEISRAIDHYATRTPQKKKRHEVVGHMIKAQYFNPVTRGGVIRFLGLEGGQSIL